VGGCADAAGLRPGVRRHRCRSDTASRRHVMGRGSSGSARNGPRPELARPVATQGTRLFVRALWKTISSLITGLSRSARHTVASVRAVGHTG
jgi:hypothetical protein